MKWVPDEYMLAGVRFLVERACAGLFWDPGLGKTSTMLAAFSLFKKKRVVRGALVLCPLRVAYSVWPREMKKWVDFNHLKIGVLHGPDKDETLDSKRDVYVMNYEGLPWLFDRLMAMDEWPFDVLIIDECFSGDTLIQTEHGEKRIDAIHVGERVLTSDGLRPVIKVAERRTQTTTEITTSHGDKICTTQEHPIFTEFGWVPAGALRPGWTLFDRDLLRELQEGILAASGNGELQREKEHVAILLQILRSELYVENAPRITGTLRAHHAAYKHGPQAVEQRPAMVGRDFDEDQKEQSVHQRTIFEDPRWQRDRIDQVRSSSADSLAQFIRGKLCDRVGEQAARLSYELQSRLWQPNGQDRYRSRWQFSQHVQRTSGRPQERSAVAPPRVVSVTHQEHRGGQNVWNLQIQGAPHFFANGILVHNSSKVKSQRTERYRLLRPLLRHFRRRYIMTGSPAPNGLLDLFGQVYAMDMGATFGPYYTKYRDDYFDSSGYGGYVFKIKPGADKKIHRKLAPRVLRMAEKDYLKLPKLIVRDVPVILPPKARVAYNEMEEVLRTVVADTKVSAVNAGVASGKCRQIAGGGVFHSDEGVRDWKPVHDAKTEAVVDLVEELAGQPAMVIYEYTHELERLKKAFPKATVATGCTMKRALEIEDEWNRGDIEVLLVQPQSVSHGLNLQEAGRAQIWHTPTWDYELYDQMIRRMLRRGRKEPVIVYRLIATGTVDEAVVDALAFKGKRQNALHDALRNYWKKRTI